MVFPSVFHPSLPLRNLRVCFYLLVYLIFQIVNIIGHVDDEMAIKPDTIDIGMCYLASSEQTANFHVQNNSRAAVPFEINLPSELLEYVKFSLSKGYLKAGSSTEISIRLHLKLSNQLFT